MFFKANFVLILLLVVLGATRASTSGLRGGGSASDAGDGDNDHVVVFSSSNATQSHRQTITNNVSRRTVLIIRVNNPATTESQIYHAVFVDMKQQMAACSADQLEFEPTRYGVMNLQIPMRLRPGNVNEFVRLAESAATNHVRGGGVNDIREVADHVVFVLPRVEGFVGSADVGSPPGAGLSTAGFRQVGMVSKYGDGYSLSLTVLMHEFVSRSSNNRVWLRYVGWYRECVR